MNKKPYARCALVMLLVLGLLSGCGEKEKPAPSSSESSGAASNVSISSSSSLEQPGAREKEPSQPGLQGQPVEEPERLLGMKRYDGNGALEEELEYRYEYQNGTLKETCLWDGELRTVALYNQSGDKLEDSYLEQGEAAFHSEYEYNGDGQLIQLRIYCYGEQTEEETYSYDEEGRRESCIRNAILYGDPGREEVRTHYVYDENGLCLREEIAGTIYIEDEEPNHYESQIQYTYDQEGRLVEMKQGNVDTVYVYDQDGRLVEQEKTDSFDSQSLDGRMELWHTNDRTAYTYDSYGRLVEENDTRLIEITDQNGSTKQEGYQNRTTYAYDEKGRCVEKNYYRDGKLLERRDYTYGIPA